MRNCASTVSCVSRVAKQLAQLGFVVKNLSEEISAKFESSFLRPSPWEFLSFALLRQFSYPSKIIPLLTRASKKGAVSNLGRDSASEKSARSRKFPRSLEGSPIPEVKNRFSHGFPRQPCQPGPAVQPSGMINKPNVQQKLPTLPATLLPSTVVARERDSKAAAAQILRTKRIRIAQDHVVRTAGKENGCPPGFKGRPEHITDIYQGDDTSEALVVAYVEHIYSYLHFREETRLKQNYMDEMSGERSDARHLDGLAGVSVAYKFHMCQDTLFLAVDITDRFLAVR
ncbi:hypothetical protein BV898_06513 [Hypsibius exemplaris]|uniref:Uncharacterized protein n=1 Tax=Hypsibius exemplaris TaxID=2072580 RepID=A0A1W0WWG7_HYPEX|nr:hypothetical protein BV898_06513 [Hypsibius exemplaris]